MTFQFSLWDKFKELGNISSSTFSNLVLLVAHLLQKKSLSISILKVHPLPQNTLIKCLCVYTWL